MPSPSSTTRWELTQARLDSLLQSLHPEKSLAAERYQRLHGRLCLFFMRRRSAYPEDLADEVVNRLAGKIAEGQSITHIEAFALGVARMVAREQEARSIREERAHLELRCNELSVNNTSIEKEKSYQAMEEQLTALPLTTRALLARYHGGRGVARIHERQRLAEELGLSIGTLRKRIFDLHTLLRIRLRQATHRGLEAQRHEEKSHL